MVFNFRSTQLKIPLCLLFNDNQMRLRGVRALGLRQMVDEYLRFRYLT